MQETKASTPQKYLPEDLRRLAITIVIVAIVCIGLAYLEQKTHFIVRLFSI